jgi:G protein beta subunit-like protein
VTGNEKGQLELWSIGESKRISCLSVSPLPIRWIALTKDSKRVVAGGHDGNVYIVDVARHLDEANPQRDFHVIERAHDGPILRLAVAPDGSSFVTTGSDSKAKLWDLNANGAHMHTLEHPEQRKWIWDVAYTPNSESVVTAGTDRHVRTWSVSDGQFLFDPTDPKPGITTDLKHSKGITALGLYSLPA